MLIYTTNFLGQLAITQLREFAVPRAILSRAEFYQNLLDRVPPQLAGFLRGIT